MILVVGGVFLSRDEPVLQEQTQATTATSEVKPEQPDPPLLSILSKPQGTLALAVTPWGEIFVDGKREGVSPPLSELKLAAGRHSVEIRNPGFSTYSQTIEIKPEATQRIKHKFK